MVGMIGSRLVLIGAAALVIGACTAQEAVPEATGPAATVATTTTSTVPATTAAPDTVPDTSLAETTTTSSTTTIAPTTTAAAPSGQPTSSSTEFFAGGDPDGWLYLGRWTGNDWESERNEDQELVEPTADSGDGVVIHELDINPIDGTVGAAGSPCSDDRSGPVISPNPRAPQTPGFGYRSLAFSADWSTQPRTIALVDADIAEYVAAGVAAFDDTGVDTSSGTIEQLVVADLDGDGDTESIVAFDGDTFSALLIIDADSGRAITVARDNEAVPEAPDADEPGATTTVTTAPAPSSTYRTLAVADVNGDGLMEVIVHSWVGDDATVAVNTYDGTEVEAVLTTSC
jgi:hypothetical protein